MRNRMIFQILISFSLVSAYMRTAYTEEMCITTYYPSPNGAYDALNVKRLAVGDTNEDGSVNALDVPLSDGYLLVADKLGIGTTIPLDPVDVRGNRGLVHISGNLYTVDGFGEYVTLGEIARGGSYPTYVPAGSIGLEATWNSDGVFFGLRDRSGANAKDAVIGWGDDSDDRLLFLHNNVELMTVLPNGYVGIGTTAPAAPLEVYYPLNSYGLSLTSPGYDTDTLNAGLRFHSTSNSGYQGDVVFYHRGASDPGLDIWGYPCNSSPSCCILISHFSNTGNVGVGTSSPQVKLAVNGSGTNVYATDVWVENNMHVQGNETLTQGGRGRMRVGTAWGYMGLYSDSSSSGVSNDLVLGASSGQVRVGADGTGQDLKVTGQIGTNGYSPNDVPSGWGGGLTAWDVCARASIRYTAGISGGGWDLAEEYDSKDATLKPGEIVSIDPENDNFIVRTGNQCDRSILGVVSTKPSVLMGVEWDDPKYGNLPIAIIGRVPVQVMLIEGQGITRGEMLTSSFLPGYAMKMTGQGMVVGKSLQEIDLSVIESVPQVKSLNFIKWPEDDGSNKDKPFFRVPVASLSPQERESLCAAYPGYKETYLYVGKIMVFVNVFYYGGEKG